MDDDWIQALASAFAQFAVTWRRAIRHWDYRYGARTERTLQRHARRQRIIDNWKQKPPQE